MSIPLESQGKKPALEAPDVFDIGTQNVGKVQRRVTVTDATRYIQTWSAKRKEGSAYGNALFSLPPVPNAAGGLLPTYLATPCAEPPRSDPLPLLTRAHLHSTINFATRITLSNILTLVIEFFTPCHAQLHLGPPIFEVDTQRDEG